MRQSLGWLLIFGVLYLVGEYAEASYRVFALRVSYFEPSGKLSRTKDVLSTLDPLQYEHYRGGYRSQKVELVDTWYCPGDTSRRRHCKKPSPRP